MARRGHNEGSIHKRLDGRWAGVLNLGWENGKRKRKTYYGKTRREVQELLSKGAVVLRAGIRPTLNDRLTLESYFRDWLGDGVQGTVRPSTLRGYASKVSNHIVPALGHVLVSKLTPQMVRGFLSDASQKGLSARTVHHLRAILRAALNDAVRLEIISRNPATLVDSPRIPYQELNPLDPKEARELLQAVSGERLEALYSVALAVGLRQGEALALRWADFDLAEGSLSVRGTLQRFKGRFEISEPKTARSRRTVALPDFAISALRAHHKRQSEERLTAGSA